MGYLDNAGLSRFTAWVRSRLSGKQDALTPDGSITLQGGNIGVALPTKTVTKAEYDALTEAEKQAEVIYAVTDDAPGGSGGSAFEVYSTEEQRIGTWIDGKPLYRITIPVHVTNTSNSGNLGTVGKSIKRAYGKLVEDHYGFVFSVPYAQSDSAGKAITSICVGGVENEETFVFLNSTNKVDATGYVTLEYTKTTDEGGDV